LRKGFLFYLSIALTKRFIDWQHLHLSTIEQHQKQQQQANHTMGYCNENCYLNNESEQSSSSFFYESNSINRQMAIIRRWKNEEEA